jgi:hypothetical protein
MNLAVFRVVGIILFLYLLWRNLRENYDDQKLITFSWVSLLVFLVFGRLFYGLINWGVWNNDLVDWVSVMDKPGMSYIGAYLGLILISWLFSRQQQWRFLNFMEDLFRPFLVMVGFFMLDELLRSKFSLETGLFLLLMILMFPLFSWVSKRYRSFVWYKSGKKGFALLLLNFLFFLVLAPILIFFKDNLVNIILSIIISLVSLVGLFILGEIKYEKK